MPGKQIGIDLGTANTLVYVKGKGVVLNEPTVVAISTRDGVVKQVGKAVQEMVGRNPDTLEIVYPMKDGVIADYQVTEAMLKYFLRKAQGLSIFRPEVMIAVPAGATSVEMRAVRDAALRAGARVAYLIPEPLAAAIGARLPIYEARGNMVVDIGGGTTEVAVLALNGIVVSNSVRIGGNRMDEAIAAYVKRKYNLLIGTRSAEEIKIQVGSALPMDNPLTMTIRGRDQVTGLPHPVEISSNEVAEALAEPLRAIVQAIREVLTQTPPELAADIVDRGIVLTGGGSKLRRLDDLLTEATGVPVFVADEPETCVAVGTGLALESREILQDSLIWPERLGR